MRTIAKGVLKEGFKIHNTLYTVDIPAQTKVFFGYDSKTKEQVINFEGYEIALRRKAFKKKFGKWIAWVYQRPMKVHFPEGGVPYPVSYFN